MRSRVWFLICLLSGLIVLGDEILKNLALRFLPDETTITGQKIVEFAIHKNFGIAFDLPAWLPIVSLFSAALLVGLVVFAVKKWSKEKILAVSAIIIACGAAGNLFDRLVYGFTVDYIIFPATGSAFNLSDVVIIFGLLTFLWHRKHLKRI